MFRYRADAFAGLSKSRLLRALAAEGVPASAGYTPLNREPFLANALASREFQSIYSKERLDRWHESNHCPENDRLCEQTLWLPHYMLLGSRTEMEQIADALRKIHAHASELAKP
jgi:dTDP-4-amino-4,6-dideoxygalactose transaminase